MMKTLFSFLFVFLFLLGFGQTNIGFVRDSLKRIEEKKLEKKIIDNFKDIELEFLKIKIVDDIDFDRLYSKNILFYYKNWSYNISKVLIDLNDAIEPNNNFKNPVFNQKDFWTKEILRRLCKKSRKNFIPILNGHNITDTLEFSKDLDNLFSKNEPFKNLLDDFKIGMVIIYNKVQKIQEEKKIYYFNDNKKTDLILYKNYNSDVENIGKLDLEFSNYLDKIITVKFIYNEKDIIIKSYQYQNKTWVEIPTKKEHEF